MTEHEIEVKIEKTINVLDKLYLAGDLSAEDYARLFRDLNVWAAAKYEEVHHDA